MTLNDCKSQLTCHTHNITVEVSDNEAKKIKNTKKYVGLSIWTHPTIQIPMYIILPKQDTANSRNVFYFNMTFMMLNYLPPDWTSQFLFERTGWCFPSWWSRWWTSGQLFAVWSNQRWWSVGYVGQPYQQIWCDAQEVLPRLSLCRGHEANVHHPQV